MSTMLDVLDLTDLEEEVEKEIPCQRCHPTQPGGPFPAAWACRFSHVEFAQHHVVLYCDRCFKWIMGNPEMDLICPCTPDKPKVEFVSSWPLK